MSLQNLGKFSEIIKIFNSAKDASDDLLALDGVNDAMENLSKGIKTDDAIKFLKKLGIEGVKLREILEKCGRGTDEIDEAFARMSRSGGSAVDKLKEGFSGLLTLGKKFFSSGAGLTTIAVGAIAALTAVTLYQKQEFERAVDTANESRAAYTTLKSELESATYYRSYWNFKYNAWCVWWH